MATEYPSDWDARRKEVYQRDGYQCQNCGRTGGPKGDTELHAHHIVPKSNGGSHAKSNLVTVCQHCHDAIHGDSTAPTSGRSTQRGQTDYFGALSDTTGDIAELQRTIGLYGEQTANLLSGRGIDESQHADLEERLLEMAFSLKTDIAAGKRLDPPDRVGPDVEFAIDEVFTLTQEIIQTTITTVETVRELKQEGAEALEARACPECGAAIDDSDNFCAQCGEDVSSLGECPDCGASIEAGDAYCSECGADLSDVESGHSFDGVEATADRASELADGLQVLMKRSTLYALRATAGTGAVNRDKPIDTIEWEYCPNCGLRQGVWVRDGTAECVLCTATWESEGLLSTKWKMTSGEDAGEVNDDGTWTQQGKQRHSQERYEAVFEETDHETLSDRISRFT